MSTAASQPSGGPAPRSLIQRLSTLLYTRSRLLLALLLGPPLIWLGLIYLGSLFALLIQSFFYLDGFTGLVVRRFTLATYAQLFTWSNFDIFARTTSMAAAVTVASAILAFPLAYYMARHASPRLKAFLYLAVIMPLWSSYLIRVYSWRLILAKEGILNSFVFNFDTTGEIVRRLMAYEYYGYPRDFLEKFKANVEKVTAEDVLKAAKARLQPDKLVLLAVGRSEATTRAARSHTGALVSDTAAVDAGWARGDEVVARDGDARRRRRGGHR